MTLGHELRVLELGLNDFLRGRWFCGPRCEPCLLGSPTLTIVKAIIGLVYMYLCRAGRGDRALQMAEFVKHLLWLTSIRCKGVYCPFQAGLGHAVFWN